MTESPQVIAERIRRRLCDMFALDPEDVFAVHSRVDSKSWYASPPRSEVRRWLERGWHEDWILKGCETVRNVRSEPPRTLAYFTAVLERMASDEVPNPEKEASTRDQLVNAVRAWRITGRWRLDHVPPDHPQFPPEVLAEAERQRARA